MNNFDIICDNCKTTVHKGYVRDYERLINVCISLTKSSKCKKCGEEKKFSYSVDSGFLDEISDDECNYIIKYREKKYEYIEWKYVDIGDLHFDESARIRTDKIVLELKAQYPIKKSLLDTVFKVLNLPFEFFSILKKGMSLRLAIFLVKRNLFMTNNQMMEEHYEHFVEIIAHQNPDYKNALNLIRIHLINKPLYNAMVIPVEGSKIPVLIFDVKLFHSFSNFLKVILGNSDHILDDKKLSKEVADRDFARRLLHISAYFIGKEIYPIDLPELSSYKSRIFELIITCASLFVVAHEIAHVLLDHQNIIKKSELSNIHFIERRKELEFEADRWALEALCKFLPSDNDRLNSFIVLAPCFFFNFLEMIEKTPRAQKKKRQPLKKSLHRFNMINDQADYPSAITRKNNILEIVKTKSSYECYSYLCETEQKIDILFDIYFRHNEKITRRNNEIRNKKQNIRLHKGKNINGEIAWYLIILNDSKLDLHEIFKQQKKKFDLSHYGEIIESGFGDSVPGNIQLEIKEKYGFDDFW